MIILTAAQAAFVLGKSPVNDHAALDPRPLKDGTFELHQDVLADKANTDVHDYLAKLPTRTVLASERFGNADSQPSTETWIDAGVRKS